MKNKVYLSNMNNKMIYFDIYDNHFYAANDPNKFKNISSVNQSIMITLTIVGSTVIRGLDAFYKTMNLSYLDILVCIISFTILFFIAKRYVKKLIKNTKFYHMHFNEEEFPKVINQAQKELRFHRRLYWGLLVSFIFITLLFLIFSFILWFILVFVNRNLYHISIENCTTYEKN